MKSQFVNVSLMVLVIMSSCSLTKTTPEVINEITRKVQNKDFIIEIKSANPLRMRTVFLTADYDLRILNDSAFAYLPYFGVAHTASYGGDGGIVFGEPMSNYTITPNKKNNGWDIRFKVKSKENSYDFYINVFNNGSSSFTVNSYNRDVISFIGEIKL